MEPKVIWINVGLLQRMYLLLKVVRGPVSWKSNLQSTITLSTREIEYMAETEYMAVWLQELFGGLLDHANVFCDSQSAIHSAVNQITHTRTKHINVKFHKIRQMVEDGDIILLKIGTFDNHVDILTKSIPLNKFKHCLDSIGIQNI